MRHWPLGCAALLAMTVFAAVLASQSSDNVLIVVNESSPLSRTIGEYYSRQRAVPLKNVCRIRVPPAEDTSRADYDDLIAKPIARFLASRKLQETISYIVTTGGVPLRIAGSSGLDGETAAVDSELTLLYSDMRGAKHSLRGGIANPLFAQRDKPFTHSQFPIYLVTRLAGYDFNDVKGMIDRSLVAANRGKFVIDLKENDNEAGDNWLREAAARLPKDRVVFDDSTRVVTNESEVIGYASWGSNDSNRKKRFLGFKWLPGAIMTEFVSENARTFTRPPDNWNIATFKSPQSLWFAGSPQSLSADYIHEGATGAAGHVSEPYLHLTPRPNYLLPAYYEGRNLAESYYLSIPFLSWQNIVIGDPLCKIGKPR